MLPRRPPCLCGLLLVLLGFAAAVSYSAPHPRVGASNRAYFSWAAELLAGTDVKVVPIVPAGVDPHHYAARPEDVQRLEGLDYLVLNDLGHDKVLEDLLSAAGLVNVPRARLDVGVALIPYGRRSGHRHGGESARRPSGQQQYNPHTFISLSSAIQQIHNLSRGLITTFPQYAPAIRTNRRSYIRRLRHLRARFDPIITAHNDQVIATIHDGYAYLLEEFGFPPPIVVQPRHGVDPTPGELARTIDAIRQAHVTVVLSELDFPRAYAQTIEREAKVALAHLTHFNSGPYEVDTFYKGMESNLEALAEVLARGAKLKGQRTQAP